MQHTRLVEDPAAVPLVLASRALREAGAQKTSRGGSAYWPFGDGGILVGDAAGDVDGIGRVDQDGNLWPLVDVQALEAEQDQVRQQAENAAKQAQQAADKAEQVRKDAQTGIDEAKRQAQQADTKADQLSAKANELAGRISDVTTTVNGQQTTLDGLSVRVEGAVEQADAAVSSVSELSQNVNGMKSTVEQAIETADGAMDKATSVEQTADGLSSQVTQTAKTAQSALDKATSVEQTADGIRADLTANYTPTSQADQKYATRTQLEATSEGLSASISEAASTAGKAMDKATKVETTAGGLSSRVEEVARTADGAVTTASKAQQTADNLSSQVTQTAKTATDALERATSAQQDLTGFKQTASQTYETKQDALAQHSSLQQTVDGFKSEVARQYATKKEFEDLSIGGTNLLKLGAYGFHSAVTGTSYDKANDLYKFTVPANATTNNSWGVGLNTHKGKSYVSGGVPWQKYGILSFYIHVDHACSIKIDVNTQAWTGSAAGTGNDHDTNRSNSSLSIPANQWTQVWQRWQNANTDSSTGNPNKVDLYDCSTIGVMSTSSAINVQIKKLKFEVGTKPSEWSPCPADQDATYSTKSYVDQTSRSISLGVVEEYKSGQHGSALATKTDITTASDSITQKVSQTYLSKSDASSTYTKRTEWQQTNDGFTATISKAQSTADAAQSTANAAKKQTYNTVNASSGTAGYFRFATLKINTTYTNQPIYFSLSNRGQKASNVWVQFNNTNSNDPTLNYIQADGGLNVWIHKTATSTWEMIAQKSEGYDVLYVNDYANHNNITVTWVNAFLSSVPSGSTQATRLASKRPSSDIDNAQSAASNAQSRVGALETLIRMDSNGVRVGKSSNGSYTQPSARVSSDGTFQMLSSSGGLLVEFGAKNQGVPYITSGSNDGSLWVGACPNTSGSANKPHLAFDNGNLDVNANTVRIGQGSSWSAEFPMNRWSRSLTQENPVSSQVFPTCKVEGWAVGPIVMLHVTQSDNMITKNNSASKIATLSSQCRPPFTVKHMFGVQDGAWLWIKITTDGNVYVGHDFGATSLTWSKPETTLTFLRKFNS